MSDTSQIIGPFERRIQDELRAVLEALGWEDANVMVLETSSGNAMIQIIYPFGYDTAKIIQGEPTIFTTLEDFLRDKLGANFFGFVIRSTHVRVWVEKKPEVFTRLMDLPRGFAV